MKKIFYLILACSIWIISCKTNNKETVKMIYIKNKNNGFNIYQDAQFRVSNCQSIKSNTALSTELDEAAQMIYFSISVNDSPIGSNEYIGFSIDSLPNYKMGLASFKYGTVKAWTQPQQIATIDSLKEKDNQFFIWQYNDSTYAALMPLMGNNFVSQIGKENGKLAIKAYAHVETSVKNVPVAALAFGKNPFQLVETLYEKGLNKIGKASSLRKNKSYPALFDNMMWCTWNSFGHGLNEQKVLEGMNAFKKQGFELPLLLLDDGWSVVSSYGTGMLKSFKTEQSKFPNGFKPLVDKLKNEYGVKEVGVWHAFNGYWAGIDPNSELGLAFKNDLIPYLDKVAWTENPIDTFWFIHPDKGFEFYNQWYLYLKEEGISFLKVDNQLVMDRISKNNMAFALTAEKMQANMQNAVKKHFNGNVINCMDMTTDAVYNFGSSAIGRASEDFFPENFSYNMNAGNAAVHVLGNVHNSVWWSQMVFPDFDMFQTHHPDAVYHAIVRAISGGPVYMTDSPGKTNFDILNRLIYSDGTIIRADKPAMPTEDCLFQVQDAKPFKIQSMSNAKGLLAIINAADADSVSGSFSPSDIDGMKGNKFVCYEYFSGQAQLADWNTKIPVSLSRMGYKLYFVAALENGFSSLGLINKYNAPKTIISEKAEGKKIEIQVKESGLFAAYSTSKPLKIMSSTNQELAFSFENNIVKLNLPQGVNGFRVELE